MRRLFWKEWRERRWWALIWTLAILGIALFGGGQTFYGDHLLLTSPLQLLPLAIGLLTGAGAYAGELARSQSVFSRPINRRALLTTKLLMAAVICLGASLLAAVITWCIMPAPYRHLATPANLLSGALGVAAKNWLIYLLGLTGSVVIPGLAGGVLTLIAALLPLVAVTALAELYLPSGFYSFSSEDVSLHQYAVAAGLTFGTWLGITAAGLSITRFAVVLGNDERIKRFTLVFLPLFLLCGLTGVLLPEGVARRLLLHREVGLTYISPTGQYAMVNEVWRPINIIYQPIQYPAPYGDMHYLVRLRDHRHQSLPSMGIAWGDWNWNWHWITDKVACVYILGKERLILIYPDRGIAREVRLPGRLTYLQLSPSPDGRLLPVKVQCNREVSSKNLPEVKHEYYQLLIVLDLQTGQIRGQWEIDNIYYPPYIWWKSNDMLAYRTMKRKSGTKYFSINHR